MCIRDRFERIINDSGFITLTRLTGDEITGTAVSYTHLPEEARATAGEFAETGEYDIIFIDLPGSMDVPGVLQTILMWIMY